MNSVTALLERCAYIEKEIRYNFKDKELLIAAFVHRSFFNEHRDLVKEHNERLEFLGDSILGLIVSDYLYAKLPYHTEGHLSHLRSHIVGASSCSLYMQKLGISDFVLLGKGERMGEGRGRLGITSDLFEAIIGAIYLDGGLEEAKGFFLTHFSEEIETVLHEPLHNWKAELQDYSQKKYQKPPVYKVAKETGPDHGKFFEVIVMIDGKEMGNGVGSSKKQAEQAAAENAINKLKADG